MKAIMPACPIDLCDTRKEAAAAQAHELIREAKTVQQEFVHSNILTSNSEMRRIVRIAQQVANADVPVLMLGESGVGKDVFAHFIHNKSNRFGNPFVKVNCAALPHELLESELFGHDKGAFTGAILDRPGKFEQANNRVPSKPLHRSISCREPEGRGVLALSAACGTYRPLGRLRIRCCFGSR